MNILSRFSLEEWEAAVRKYEFRRDAAKDLLAFGLIYFPHYLYLTPGDFVVEFTQGLGDLSIEFLEMIGFRGSSKSVWGTIITPIWLALEHSELYPFIIPITDTIESSTTTIGNIRTELEDNELLRQDYGRFKIGEPVETAPKLESEEDWRKQNLLLSNGVRILGRSRGQRIRGLRHRQFRPRAVIVDDPEDLEWVQQQKNRDKTERYLTGEVIPGMDENTRKFVLIGNYLHGDSIMVRMKPKMNRVIELPLVREGEGPQYLRCTWPAKYPTQEALEKKKKEMGEVAWQREMMLKLVPEDGVIIGPEDIVYYDEIPEEAHTGMIAHGVDLAISKDQGADFTAIIDGITYRFEGKARLCISPGQTNRRMDFAETMNTLMAMNARDGQHVFYVEEVAYQKAAIEMLQLKQVPVIPVKPIADKRARLMVAAQYIKDGTVQFPRKGSEDLITQLCGFGIEAHDDMVDALVYLILATVAAGLDLKKIVWVG